jgi:hypothetical protein
MKELARHPRDDEEVSRVSLEMIEDIRESKIIRFLIFLVFEKL